MTALLAVALLTAPDFAADSDAWNGASYLETTAEEARVVFTAAGDEVDWSTVARAESLLLLAPGDDTDIRALRSFVMDGGHAVIALDVGANADVAEAFGLKLLDGPVIHDDYFEDHPAFPRLTPDPEDNEPHFLWYNVASLVLNHPAALAIDTSARTRTKAEVVIPFAEPDQAFAIEVELGDGYALFLSDASVFINDMQRHAYGDKQFVANVLRYYCEDLCQGLAVPPDARHRGRYRPDDPSGFRGLERMFALAVEELNAVAADVGRRLGTPEVLFAMSVTLLGGLLFGSGLLPWPRPVPRFAWQDDARARPSDLEYRARALARSRQKADFSGAARALMHRYEAAVRGRRPSGPAAAGCEEIFAVIRANESRPGTESRISFETFEKLWTDCDEVLEELEGEDGYESAH